MAIKTSQFHEIYFPKRNEHLNHIMQRSDEAGTGEKIRYDAAPGIQITYNGLIMDSCFQPIIPEHDFLQIDHCLEDCYECEMAGGAVSFLPAPESR